MSTRKLTSLSLSVALAMLLSFIESQIPPFIAVPGIKVGLSNVVTVFLLYSYGWREAGFVSLIRVCLSSLLFGSAVSLAYALSGALLSLIVMMALKPLPFFSEIGISVAGGVFHNTGQIICACLIMENSRISAYLPALIISGTIAGAVVGIVSGMLIKKLKGKI